MGKSKSEKKEKPEKKKKGDKKSAPFYNNHTGLPRPPLYNHEGSRVLRLWNLRGPPPL